MYSYSYPVRKIWAIIGMKFENINKCKQSHIILYFLFFGWRWLAIENLIVHYWHMGTDDIDLQHTVQFSGFSFSVLLHIWVWVTWLGKFFWRNVINFIVRTMLFYFCGWYGIIENYAINTIICITVQVWQTLHFILAETRYLKLSVLDVVFFFSKMSWI